MKVFLALAVLATSAASYAADNREIQDIMYLPNTGTTYGFSTVSFLNGEIESDAGDSEITGMSLNQTIGHSFTDRFSLQASLGYNNTETDEDFTGGSKTEATGLTDPTISARFRTMDEAFRWDVIGGATIGLGDSEIDSDGDSNNFQGGSSLFAGTQFGGKSTSFQWAIAGILTHNMETTVDDDNAADEIKNDANNELQVRLDLLATLGEKSYLRPHLLANFTESFEDDQSPAEETASATTYEVGAEFQHKLSNDLMLRAGVDYGIINTRTAQIDDFSYWNFLAGANYQF